MLTLKCLCAMYSFLEARIDSQGCGGIEAGGGGHRFLFEKPECPDYSKLRLDPYSALS